MSEFAAGPAGRIERVRALMAVRGYDAIVVRDEANLRWLTGVKGVFDYTFEFPHAAFITADQCLFHTDSRYLNSFEENTPAGSPWVYDMDEGTIPGWVAGKIAANKCRVCAVEDDMQINFYQGIQRGLEDRSVACMLPLMHDDIRKMRAIKDAEEIELMRHAQSITDAAFQTVTIITTTGFATVDFALWPTFCRMALVMLMFTGACAGSTSGGIKISRVAILCKSLKRELKRLAHPHHVSVLKVDGQAVEERVVSSAGAFIAAYLLVLLAGALVVSWDNYGFQESFAASLTCISNVGPGLGILGPMENFSILSPLSKLVLSLEMLMGRLELMPLLALFLGSTWRD